MPKHSKTVKCLFCDKEVRYKTYGSNRFAVEGKRIDFLPNAVDGNTLFVNLSGSVILGIQVSDGQIGYRLHDCQGTFANKKAAHVGERV